MQTETIDLREVVIFLTAAGLVVPLMHRLRISPVLGFLVVGLAIGPSGLGQLVERFPWLATLVIEDREALHGLAELGIVFLLFTIGLELSLERLISMRHTVFGLGSAQVMITGSVIAAIAFAFGNPAPASLVIGACLALSSTAIATQLLVEKRRLGTPIGRVCFGILLFQDLAVVPILFLVGVLGSGLHGSLGISFLIALGKAVLAIGIILAVGKLLLRPFFRFVGATHSRELFMAAVLLVIIATAILTQRAGMSLALGAFLTGLLLAETEYRHQVSVDLEPFKGLMLGLFFLSVGLNIDLAAVAGDLGWILLSVVGLYLLKTTILVPLILLFRHGRAIAVEGALLLGQGGEFALVAITLAAALGIMAPEAAQFILVVTSITMLVTPVVAALGRRAGARLAAPERPDSGRRLPDLDGELSGHVIVAGYGRVGQLLGSLLGSHLIPHVGLDLDANVVSKFREIRASVYFGDASHPEILQRAAVDRAVALAVTMDDVDASERIVIAVRKAHATLPILVRARDAEHARRLFTAGATGVVPETVEASLELAEQVLSAAGFSDDAARQVVAERRDFETRRLLDRREDR